MFFTKLARLFAVVAFVFGIARLLIGLAIAVGVIGPYEAALARYAGHASSSGQVIDSAIYVIVAAVALGTLAEIGRAIHKNPPLVFNNWSSAQPDPSVQPGPSS
jgi:hypothetical protein